MGAWVGMGVGAGVKGTTSAQWSWYCMGSCAGNVVLICHGGPPSQLPVPTTPTASATAMLLPYCQPLVNPSLPYPPYILVAAAVPLPMQIAIEMLQSGKVDAVVCVQSDENDRWARRRWRVCVGVPEWTIE